MITKIISGAQTGADQGGLEAGITIGLATGGWIPKGLRTEGGKLDRNLFLLWRLSEHPSWAYPPRTEMNVMEADGTLIVGNIDSPGCKLTVKYCNKHGKPFLHVLYPDVASRVSEIKRFNIWAKRHFIETLNVAGNRESTNEGISKFTHDFLVSALQ
jgi:hypothetical protein